MTPLRTRWLNRTVLGIGLASLCSDAGHEMATAALPTLLTSIGATVGALGLIEGWSDFASGAAKLAAGLYTDRLHHRKPFAAAGYFLTASGMASFAIATTWVHVLLGRMIGWAGRGARSPVRNVLLADGTAPENYGRAFGFERAMDSLGAVIGPAMAFILIGRVALTTVFLATLIPGLAAALCILVLVREAPHHPKPTATLRGSFAAIPRSYWRFLVGVGFAGLGDFANSLLILFAGAAFAPIYGETEAARIAIMFYTGYNVIYAATCYGAGAFADRFPKRLVLATGYAIATIPAIALLWDGEPWLRFTIIFGVSGLYMGVWETVESASAAELLPQEVRGLGFGLLATVNGFGDLVSSAVVGLLWSESPAGAMSWVIGTSLIGAWLVARTRRT
ncbi:MAG: MFS transporter [Gemmataceae bacterium]